MRPSWPLHIILLSKLPPPSLSKLREKVHAIKEQHWLVMQANLQYFVERNGMHVVLMIWFDPECMHWIFNIIFFQRPSKHSITNESITVSTTPQSILKVHSPSIYFNLVQIMICHVLNKGQSCCTSFCITSYFTNNITSIIKAWITWQAQARQR